MTLTDNDIAVNLESLAGPTDLQELFDHPGPIHLEIGSGKGTFLLNQAKKHPDINFFGIEWANKYYRHSVGRMRRWQMNNIRILRGDAREFIAKYLSDGCLQALHIYFPDPWPKKRHHKRRFFTQDNLLQVIRCLEVGGELRVATDHADYYGVICDVMLGQDVVAKCFTEIEFCPTDAASDGELVGSNFERKYIKDRRKIYTMALRKR